MQTVTVALMPVVATVASLVASALFVGKFHDLLTVMATNLFIQHQEPTWRVKTRPCEFHLKGRCIFGEDRCNFLHSTPHDFHVYDSISTTSMLVQPHPQSRSHHRPDYSALKNDVLGELRQKNKHLNGSSQPSSPINATERIRSPPRSPRRASLLFALKDIIGDDIAGEEVEKESSFQEKGEGSQTHNPSMNRESSTTATATVRAPPIDISLTTSSHSPLVNPDHIEEDDTMELIELRRSSHTSHISTLSALSSSLGLSQFPIPPSYHTFSKDDEEEALIQNDSGFYDTTKPWKPPSPPSLSPPPPTATRSKFGLLHSPFGSPSSRLNIRSSSGLMSPRLVSPTGATFVPRLPLPHGNSDMDSVAQINGYGAEFEANCGNDSDMSMESLDSPTVYHRKRELEERRTQMEEKELERKIDGEIGSGADSSLEEWSMQDMDILKPPSSSSRGLRIQTCRPEIDHRIEDDEASTPRSFFEDDDDDDYIAHEEDQSVVDEDSFEQEEEAASSGHTSLWDDSQRNHDTIVFLGKRTKTESTGLNVNFVEEEIQGCSSFTDDHDDIDEDYEETARLAYAVDRENDTLHSLYDVYSDIGDEVEDDSHDNIEPETPARIPLPSPTHSEVHAYALLALFERNKKEEHRIAPADAWAYEPDGSFSSNSGSSVTKDLSRGLANASKTKDFSKEQGPERVFSPSFPFIRERVFTPPPPPTPPIPFKEEETIPPLPVEPHQHRTPLQSSTSTTRRQTPRSAPAATAVYENDKRRTSTMVDPDTPMPPKVSTTHQVHQQETEGTSDASNEDLEDPARFEDATEVDKVAQEKKGKYEVLRRGLKPLRLSTLLLLDNANTESPILSAAESVFGYSDGAGSRPSSTVVKAHLDSATYKLSDNAHINATHDFNDKFNIISHPSNGLLSSTNQTSSYVTPPASSSSSSAILDSDSQSLSVVNAPPSSSSSLSSSSSQPSQSQQQSSMPSSRPRPTSLSVGSRQSRIYYIRHVDPDPDIPIPKTAPLVPTDPAWKVTSSRRGSMLSPIPKASQEEDSDTSADRHLHSRFDGQKAGVDRPEKQHEELGSGSTTSKIPYTRLSHLRRTLGEDMGIHPLPPPPIRIPTPSLHSQSQQSSLSQSVSAESLAIRSRSSRTSPLVENLQHQQSVPTSASASSAGRRPTLLFAIASDDPVEVQKALEEASAPAVSALQPTSKTSSNINTPNTTSPYSSPIAPVSANDTVGPQSQSALEFVLTNDGLRNKLDIVKVLLGYGADPLKAGFGSSSEAGNTNTTGSDSIMKKVKSKLEDLDETTRYYLSRATSGMTRKTAALLQRSTFRPLQRMRYMIIGQDRALEQLFRVLSMHSHSGAKMGRQQQPVVVFLCGPSGHGKSLLAHQFGSLLDVPTHTVNMTTLRSADDLWKSYSISSGEETVPCTLVEFLANNEGKRCVVVLDEIEKTEDAKALWSLLVPWELGRCTFEANSRTIDVRNVIWVCTSNIGQDIIFSFHESRSQPNNIYTREEYVELMGILRPRVSDQLGASVLSRVSAILPFVPFTEQERRAIAAEFVMQSEKESELVKELVLSQDDKEVERRWRERIIQGAMDDFILSEGARSLYRAVSSHLVDSLDDL